MDKSLFKRAIEDTQDATPGYMFRDITNWTFQDQGTQTKLLNALFEKLNSKTSAHVLAKVLRIIKVLCETGHQDFQREVQRRSDQIKDFASYRGPMDAQFGDRFNEKVRIAAKEAMEAAFSPRRENKLALSSGHGSNTVTKDGNKSVFTSNNRFGDVTGDSRVAEMPATNKWAEHMARGGKDEAKDSIFDRARLGFGFFGNERVKKDGPSDAFGLGGNVGDFKAVDIALVGGHKGSFGPTSSGGGGGDEWKFNEEASLPPVEQATTLGRLMTPYQKEVERISQMKSIPLRVDLTQFAANVKEANDQGLPYEELAAAIDEYLAQKHTWQSRLNVMTVLEHLLKLELSNEISDYFKENPEDVQRNINVVQSSLKERSIKVARLLGLPEKTHTPAPEATPTGQTSPTGDLDFGGMVLKKRSKGAAAVAGGFPNGPDTATEKDKDNNKDKTKLRKRAPISMEVFDDITGPTPAPVPAPAPGFSDGWGDGGSAGATDWASPTVNDWASVTSTAGNDWGEMGSLPCASDRASPTMASPVAQPPATDAAMLGGPPTAQTNTNSFIDDFFSSGPETITPSAPAKAPPPPPQVTTGNQGPQIAMIRQMQEQLQTMMSRINMSDPSSLTQMQSLMQQQQQLISMMNQISVQGTDAPAPAPAPGPQAPGAAPVDAAEAQTQHATFNAPPLVHRQNNPFADMQQQMMDLLKS